MAGDLDAASDSLAALALGDCFGGRWFRRGPREAAGMIRERESPDAEPVWQYTDDTAMAVSVVGVLRAHGEIDADHLAASFGAAYEADPYRQYGYGMTVLLPRLVADPAGWRAAALELFGGEGSLGNGAAMRVAPLGAFFTGDPDRAAAQAAVSARVTHAHPEGVAGAVAVAVAASVVGARRDDAPGALLEAVVWATPDGPVRDGLLAAAGLPAGIEPRRAAEVLGNGQRIRASDTVPFAIWSAAHYAHDLAAALWCTAAGLGDVDTTCAITAGIVGARDGVRGAPADWRRRAEPLAGPPECLGCRV